MINTEFPLVFSSEEGKDWLKGSYKAPLKALAAKERSGEIIRLRRGLYAFKEGLDPLKCAYRLHEPSYISFETALAYYGLIPERVEQVISVVDGRPAKYLAAATRFIYHSQSRPLFALGMGLTFIDGQAIPIAIPEKAVLDTLALVGLKARGLSTSDVLEYVVGSLRIDFEDLGRLSLPKMKKMAPLYRNLAPKMLTEELAKIRRK